MELSIQERLKDLRVERGLTLEQLEEQANLSYKASIPEVEEGGPAVPGSGWRDGLAVQSTYCSCKAHTALAKDLHCSNQLLGCRQRSFTDIHTKTLMTGARL